MFVSRSSFEKPRPFERCVRMVSPSRYSTIAPRRSSSRPDDVGDRGLAGAREPGEPEREAAAARAVGLGVLVRVDVLGQAVSFVVVRVVDVDAAFELVGAGPAACALLLLGRRRAGAGDAADRAVPRLVQRVERDLVDVDVGPDALLVPVRERVHLPDAVALRPLRPSASSRGSATGRGGCRRSRRRRARAPRSAARPCGCGSSGRGRAPRGSGPRAGAARRP